MWRAFFVQKNKRKVVRNGTPTYTSAGETYVYTHAKENDTEAPNGVTGLARATSEPNKEYGELVERFSQSLIYLV